MADALSRKKALLCQLGVSSSPLLDRIIAKQDEDEMLRLMKESVRSRIGGSSCGSSGTQIDDSGILRINGRICVPNVDGLRQDLLQENHRSRCSIHPGVLKMYQDMKRLYWWKGMKRDISIFVSQCATCQQVKTDH